MKKFFLILVIVSFVSLQLAGCATMSETEKGAATGAVAGGVLGAILGDTRGAIIGTFAGAIVGAVVGNYYDKKLASRAEAVNEYDYAATVEKLAIEDSFVKPQQLTPGSEVEAQVQYTVLSPISTQTIKITETRALSDGKEMRELARREIVRAQGTHISTMKFTIPKDVDKGDYILITTISDGKQTKTTRNALKIV